MINLPPNRRSGFTLIEVTIASVAMILIMGGMYRVIESFSERFKERFVMINGASYSVAPSHSANMAAKTIQVAFALDLRDYQFAYVVGGTRSEPSNTSLAAPMLRPLGSSPASYDGLGLSEFPHSSYGFSRDTAGTLGRYSSGSRTFPESEFSVVFLKDLDEVHSVYSVSKGSGLYEGIVYNTYTVLLESAELDYQPQSYSFAIESSLDISPVPVGAIHRWHRFDARWDILEQDSVFVVLPDPLSDSSGLDQNGDPIQSVSRFIYEITY